VAPRGERFLVPIRIGDGFNAPGDRRPVVANTTEGPGGWREVTDWPRFFDRNQAIAALTVTELLERGRNSNDPVATLREELR